MGPDLKRAAAHAEQEVTEQREKAQLGIQPSPSKFFADEVKQKRGSRPEGSRGARQEEDGPEQQEEHLLDVHDLRAPRGRRRRSWVPRAGGMQACREHNLGVVQQRGPHAPSCPRCRLVAQNVKVYATDEFFGATPPVEMSRMVLSLAADETKRQASLVDIPRAHLNPLIQKEVLVQLPTEAWVEELSAVCANACVARATPSWEHT